ncbi:hypothetical protein AVEN_91758-1 [Araneus ventricosus]|uniref:Secreted protein n=1 Tax=Araneus ventricosus TaxID=182803 RepID=A0A4Y2HW35_ARAVE|nr:hypothetical protein AVEN_91758-1 [Araneus ventricosus]
MLIRIASLFLPPLLVLSSLHFFRTLELLSFTQNIDLKKNHMVRDQENKQVIEVPKWDAFTGTITPGGTCKSRSCLDPAHKTRPSSRRKILNACNHELRACPVRI